MAKVLIVIEDGAVTGNRQGVEIAVSFDPPVAHPDDSRTWTAAQRIGNQAIEYALRRKGVKRKSEKPLPRHSS